MKYILLAILIIRYHDSLAQTPCKCACRDSVWFTNEPYETTELHPTTMLMPEVVGKIIVYMPITTYRYKSVTMYKQVEHHVQVPICKQKVKTNKRAIK